MDYESRVDSLGTKRWYLNNVLSRVDGPAIEYPNGDEEWYIDGNRHRADGPAVEWVTGHKEWFFNGKLHREDGPAVECVDGRKYWYINGRRFKSKETWFGALKKEDKEKVLFSEHFIKG